jgi:hypothetical protein
MEYEVERAGYFDLTSIPMPQLGGKIWVLDKKGQFLLERGPGTLRTVACTGAGSGSLLVIDGVPDENGEIPLVPNKSGNLTTGWKLLLKSNPVVMGSWMLDGGFQNGLTVRHYGGQSAVAAFASFVWLPYKARK